MPRPASALGPPKRPPPKRASESSAAPAPTPASLHGLRRRQESLAKSLPCAPQQRHSMKAGQVFMRMTKRHPPRPRARKCHERPPAGIPRQHTCWAGVPDPNVCTVPHATSVAVLCCCTCPINWGSAFRIMSLTCGAKGTRTPGLLHAISRQHVHRCLSPQVTVPQRAPASAGVRAGCCTLLLYPPTRSIPLLDGATQRPITSQALYLRYRSPWRDQGCARSTRTRVRSG
jgi:hypothetical protein